MAGQLAPNPSRSAATESEAKEKEWLAKGTQTATPTV